MYIFPAIDIFEGKVVRLTKGDYSKMTIYSDNPVEISDHFVEYGASHIHIVDLEGAKNGKTPNFEIIKKIKQKSNVFCQVGGGIRDNEVVDRYVSSGIDRVILGTAAIEDIEFLKNAVKSYGNKIAVSLDILNDKILIKGWQTKTDINVFDYFKFLEEIGVECVICTDISKDGLLSGINRDLYKKCNKRYNIKIIASGGVTNIDDVKYLKDNLLYGAIIGKAYYNKSLDITQVIKLAEE